MTRRREWMWVGVVVIVGLGAILLQFLFGT